MTRETRIGLLVGLAFIIMFGLVLSDLTSSSSPQYGQTSAQTASGDWVARDELAPPTNVSSAALPPAAPAITETHAAITPPVAPTVQPVVSSAVLREESPSQFVTTPEPPVARSLAAAPAPDNSIPTSIEPASKTYTVQAGDTLIKIARKMYGPGHEGDYKQIIEANKATLKDKASLKVNQNLVIPMTKSAGQVDLAAAGGAGRKAAGGLDYRETTLDELSGTIRGDGKSRVVTVADQVKSTTQPAKADKAKSAAKKAYQVKSGDTLSKIARRLLNDDSPAAIQKIVDANKGKIKDGKTLQAGMQLEIPN